MSTRERVLCPPSLRGPGAAHLEPHIQSRKCDTPFPAPDTPTPGGSSSQLCGRDGRQAGVPVGRPAGFPSPHSHQCSGDNNTPHTHPGGDWLAAGAPLPEWEASRSTGVVLVIIGRLVVHVVQPTRAARGPHHAPSRPACPGPSVRPSASMPGCRLCSGGRGGGCSLGVGGWCWEVCSPWGGL